MDGSGGVPRENAGATQSKSRAAAGESVTAGRVEGSGESERRGPESLSGGSAERCRTGLPNARVRRGVELRRAQGTCHCQTGRLLPKDGVVGLE